tara:strand:- start:286 stop:495 length:210 start_codon:yes stop_codon:yes gene_type:complete
MIKAIRKMFKIVSLKKYKRLKRELKRTKKDAKDHKKARGNLFVQREGLIRELKESKDQVRKLLLERKVN